MYKIYSENVVESVLMPPSYGMVLAKEKNEEEAMKWLIRSVHLYPMNWGCWLEMTSLISQVEDVGAFSAAQLSTNLYLAQSNIPASATKHPLIHLPSSYLPRTLPIVTESFK